MMFKQHNIVISTTTIKITSQRINTFYAENMSCPPRCMILFMSTNRSNFNQLLLLNFTGA